MKFYLITQNSFESTNITKFLKLAYLEIENIFFWHRWIGALYQTDKHIHLIWADKDPVAIFEMVEELQRNIPENTLTVLENAGHYPMLEVAEEYADAVLKGIEK